MKTYCDRVWLNSENSRSTGSVVAFDGMVEYSGDDTDKDRTTFLEVSDCHCKISLHQAHWDTDEDFIEKMKLLRHVINDFIIHLTSRK